MPRYITTVADTIADAIEDDGTFTVPFDGAEGITLTGTDEYTGTASFEITDSSTGLDTYVVSVRHKGG